MTAPGTGAPDAGLIDVLAGAAVISLNFWNRETYDIYDCLKRSWYVREMPVAFATVLRATRRAVPGGDLYAVNDSEGCTAATIAAVFEKAARIAKATGGRGRSTSTARVPASVSCVSFTGGGGR